MKYRFAYKTSDGLRHEDEIDAESRDDVFAALRQRGIRPIKVVADDGSKANGEIHGVRKRVVAAAAVLALVAGVICAVTLTPAVRALGTPPDSQAIIDLRAQAAAISERHRAAVKVATNDTAKIAAAVSATRSEAREIFKDIMTSLDRENEQLEAKRLYGELMILADHTELAGK